MIRKFLRRWLGVARPPAPVLPSPWPTDELTNDQRMALIAWANSDATKLAFALTQRRRPSVVPAYTGASVLDEHSTLRAANRLMQIQGWEACMGAMLSVHLPPAEPAQQLQESFPDQ